MLQLSAETAYVERAAPMQQSNRDEDPERREHEDRSGGDRGVEVAGLELAIDDQRKGLRPAFDIAGEHDRGPEFAQRAGPAHDEAGRKGSGGEGDRDVAKHIDLGGAVNPRSVLQISLDAGDAGSSRPHEERCRHEGLGQDDGERRERDLDPQRIERCTQEPAPAQDQQ